MTAIDSDSHFTTPVRVIPQLRELPQELLKLVEDGHLSFGHWEVGNQHNTFVIVLRAMLDDEISDVFTKLKSACERLFGNNRLDLVIFPGESTAFHLAARFGTQLGASGKVVVASPAFRMYGNHSLRLEISKDHQDRLASLTEKEVINVLFFDDSLSSGGTENRVISAFALAKAQLGIKAQVTWLSFVVLWRGQRSPEDKPLWIREVPRLAEKENYQYKFACFSTVAPESLHHVECPLCSAHKKVRSAVTWARGARPAVRQCLDRVDDLLESRPIERLVTPLSCLDSEIVKQVLRLSEVPMPEACVYIWRNHIETPKESTIEEVLGTLIFLALNHSDACAYLPLQAFTRLLLEAVARISPDEITHSDAFMITLATLPVSTFESHVHEFISKLASARAVDLIAAVLAFTLSAQHHALVDVASRIVIEQQKSTARARRSALLGRIVATLKNANNDQASEREIIDADLRTLALPPSEHNAAWIAQTLSALLQRGNHPSFLSQQMQGLTKETAGTVMDGLHQVLGLMSRLPPSVVAHLELRIAELKQALCNCERGDAVQCRELAEIVVRDLWEQSIHPKIAIYPKWLHEQLKEEALNAIRILADDAISASHLLVLPRDEAVLDCELFGPAGRTLTSHVANLLINPFKHYPIERFREDRPEPPLAICYLRLNEAEKKLLFVVADKAKSPAVHQLWTLTRGLSNVRASLQIFGGDVEFRSDRNGLLDQKYGLTLEQQKWCFNRGVLVDSFKNLYITSFSIIRQEI